MWREAWICAWRGDTAMTKGLFAAALFLGLSLFASAQDIDPIKWSKVTVPYTRVNAMSSKMSVPIATLSARQMICGILEKHSQSFGGNGITGVWVTIGDSKGNGTTYSTRPFDIFRPVSNTAFQSNSVLGMTSITGSVVEAIFTSRGGYLYELSTGSIEFDICTVTLP
jgi:hypothetical protein